MKLWRIMDREASWRGMSACGGGCVCGGGGPQERKGEGERWGVAVSGA